MQSQCFSHNLEFNTDIDLCLYRTMDSKKTSWIYYSTCAVQVLKDSWEVVRAGRDGSCPWLWAGDRAGAAFVSHWQDLALLHLQELQKLRTAARLSTRSSQDVNPTKRRVCLKFGNLFVLCLSHRLQLISVIEIRV